MVIINEHENLWWNLEISFLSRIIFNSVFSYEKTRFNSVENKISQKENVNTKKPHMVFCQTSDF